MNTILECKNLSKSFGSTKALDGINLTIEKGRIVGLLGPNGSGKTTFIKICNELLTPTSGEVRIKGFNPGVETKKIVSYLPEKTYLNDWMKVSQIIRFFQDFYADFIPEKAWSTREIALSRTMENRSTSARANKVRIKTIVILLINPKELKTLP
jgi:ABC-2 type transport system ATP-binding protein